MVKVHDAEIISGKSGTGLRCHVTLGLGDDRSVLIKGCLAFRDKRGKLKFSPPVTQLRNRLGQPYNYKAVIMSDGLVNDISASLEKKFGHMLRTFDSSSVGIPINELAPDLPDEIEI